jgi:enhancing lycopene biosynthesis protein 2
MMKKKFAIVLSGCGVYDGSEIHEAVAAMLAVEQNGGTYQIFAPNAEQLHTINHSTGEESLPNRNILDESARIARGDIKDLTQFIPSDYDVLLFPGGFGAMKNLCNYAVAGNECSVNKDVAKALKSMFAEKKIIAAICIAPMLLARVLGNISITLGNPDESSLESVKHFGATHVVKNVTDVCIDEKNKIFTTPAYMLATNISDVFAGVNNLVKEIFKHL